MVQANGQLEYRVRSPIESDALIGKDMEKKQKQIWVAVIRVALYLAICLSVGQSVRLQSVLWQNG